MTCDSHQVEWADLWDDKAYADLTLELTVKDDPSATKYISAHRVYLQAMSEYFKSRLTQQFDIQNHGPRVVAPANGGKKGHCKKCHCKKCQGRSQPETVTPRGPSLILTVECESVEDQTTCLAAVKHAYTGELPPAEEMARIVLVCKKADYLRMPATVQACLTSLSQLAAQQQLSAELKSQLLALPHTLPEQLLTGSDSGRALLQQLRTLTASKFGNTVEVVQNKLLQQEFVALPLELLLHWASLDELMTDSENTIAVLMHVWIKQNSLQQPVGIHVTEQLSKLLRVGQLSFPFHLDALPKLAWYKPPPELPVKHALVRWGYSQLPGQVQPTSSDVATGYSWNAKRKTDDSVTLEWALSTVQIQEKWASTEVEVFEGPGTYYAGYEIGLEVQVMQKDKHKHVGLFLYCIYCSELSPEVTGPSCAALTYTIQAGEGGSLYHTHTSGTVFYDCNCWGRRQALAHPLPVEGGLQELMAYKELPIKVMIKMC